MKNLLENEEMTLLNEQDALELVDSVCTTDIWRCIPADELKSVEIPNMPIFVDQIRKDYNISKNVSDESILEVMTSGMQLGLEVPDGIFPIGDTGFASVLARAGFQQSSALSGLQEKRNFIPLAPNERSVIVNLGLKTQKESELKILIRDEKVRYVGSSDYSIIAANELFRELKKGLISRFSEVNFVSASASHEYFSIVYEMTDKELIKNFKSVLERNGLFCEDLRIALRLVTSDVGISAVSLVPALIADSVRRVIGAPLCVTHKDGHNIDNFNEKLSLVYAMFNDCEKALEEMEEKKLINPKGCFLRIAKSIGFPKKLSLMKMEDFLEKFRNPTQLDLYWQIYDLYDDFDAESGGLTQTQILDLEEGISRCIFGGIDNYDFPYDWV